MKHPLVGIALIAALVSANVGHAASLGRAKVLSYLNQPLNLEIDLVGITPGEHLDLRLRIANQEHFDRLGIAYLPIHRQMQFDIVQTGGRWVARARTPVPVSEPFVDFPLQMSWPGGRLVKQYSVLLDPVNYTQPAEVSRTASKPPARAQASRPPQTENSANLSGARRYGSVQRGETLWPIAQKTKPRGITTHQMAVALVRANPHAFIDGDMNKLRAGVTLDIPTREFIEQTDPSSARKTFAEQTRIKQPDVATSRRVLQGEADVSTSERTPSKTDTAQNNEAPSDESATLRIVTRDSVSGEQALEHQLLATMEEIESNRLNTGAIETRLARLEEELARMQKLIDLKDEQIVALESELAGRATDEPTTAPAPSEVPATDVANITTAELEVPLAPADDDVVPVVASVTPTPTAMPITTIERMPTPARASDSTLYDRYLWVVWVILGLLGATALILWMRRPTAAAGVPMAQLPEISNAPPRPYTQNTAATSSPTMDDPRLQPAAGGSPSDFTASTLPLAELDISDMLDDTEETVEVADSLLQEIIEESKLLEDHPAPQTVQTDQPDDDDIASWVADLGGEAEVSDKHSANDERIDEEDDLDIPSILTEIDDRLNGADADQFDQQQHVHMEPVDDGVEDETFAMSLDLARAYLEIGDQDGARDMLKQALHGARSPAHRTQIEDLLKQID